MRNTEKERAFEVLKQMRTLNAENFEGV